MNLKDLITIATNKNNFQCVTNYLDFCHHYLDFITTKIQAVIVSQNESNYRFFQYKEDGNFNITRPININLMLNAENYSATRNHFGNILHSLKDLSTDLSTAEESDRSLVCNTIYTVQQSIGLTLDALGAGQSNIARKINGDLFENLIKLLIQEAGIDCRSGIINIPVKIDEIEQFKMSYQHDLLIYKKNQLKVIGSVKTSSKDRIDKIFIDKFLYNKLTETSIPHIAIFLNDVQRKKTTQENQYAINSTFLSGRFKGYSVKLNPLDGVYYCDIRPNMISDHFLHQHIKTIDCLFYDDLPRLINDQSSTNEDNEQ